FQSSRRCSRSDRLRKQRFEVGGPEGLSAGDRLRRGACAWRDKRSLDGLAECGKALEVGDEPDVAERQNLGDGQIGVTDGPAQLDADLIDGAQESVVER